MTTRTDLAPSPTVIENAATRLVSGLQEMVTGGTQPLGHCRITHADGDTVTARVRSATSGREYEVVGSRHFWACKCPGNRFRSARCWHILTVQAVWAPAERSN